MMSKLGLAQITLLLSLSATVGNSLTINDLRDTLKEYSINDTVGYETDMLNFLEQTHYFTKAARRDPGSIAVMRVANLQANLANIKHAIREGVAETAQLILDDYGLLEDSKRADLNEARAVLARVLVRAQATILEASASLWKRSYKLIEQNKGARGMGELVSNIVNRLEQDPLAMHHELQLQREALSEFNFSEALSEANFLQLADQIIDVSFKCNECSGLPLMDFDKITPLATEQTIDEWLAQYVDEHYLEKLRRSEEHIEGLIIDEAGSSNELDNMELGDIQELLKQIALEQLE